MRHEEIRTTDLNLAASIMTATNHKPTVTAGRDLVEFTFPADEATKAVAVEYATGTLMQEVRRLAVNRTWLYRQTREVGRTCRGGGRP